MANDPENLTQFVDHMVEETDGDIVTLGELLDTVSHRSYGPLLLLPALLAASPIGAIPGMSIITGMIIILIAAQMLFGLIHPWLPRKLEDVEFSRKRLTGFREKSRRWTKWLDRPLARRWQALTKAPWVQLVALACIILALLFYPLALIPYGVFLPSITICLMAVGLMARDGIVVAVGLLLAIGSIVAAIVLWPSDLFATWI